MKKAMYGLQLLGSISLFVSIGARATPYAYSEAFDTLYRVDLGTRTATRIGAAGSYGGVTLGNIEGLTYAPDGNLYAVSDTQLKVLMRINPLTGVASVIGSPLNLGVQGAGPYGVLDLGMAATCDGNLWLSSGYTHDLWRVNKASGVATHVGNFGSGVTITGLTAQGTVLLGTGSQGTPNLYTINTDTAQTISLGNYTSSGSFTVTTISPGGFAGGAFWMVLDNVPPYTGNTQPTWSDAAQFGSNGFIVDLGPITGPVELQGVGLKGLAIAPTSPCAATVKAWPNPLIFPYSRTLPGQPPPSGNITVAWNAPGYSR